MVLEIQLPSTILELVRREVKVLRQEIQSLNEFLGKLQTNTNHRSLFTRRCHVFYERLNLFTIWSWVTNRPVNSLLMLFMRRQSRGERLLQTSILIEQKEWLSSSCQIGMSRQTNNNALIGWYCTMFDNRPPILPGDKVCCILNKYTSLKMFRVQS